MHRQQRDVEGEGSPGEGGSLTVQRSGWMELTRRDLQHTLGRKWVQLVTAQKAAAEETVVMHTLYWFDRQADSVDLGTGSALDLAEIEEIDEIDQADETGGLLLTTEAGWLLVLVPEPPEPPGAMGAAVEEEEPDPLPRSRTLFHAPRQQPQPPPRQQQQQQEQQQEQRQRVVAWRDLLAATCVNAEGYGDLVASDRAATIAQSSLRQHGAAPGGVMTSGPALRDTLRMAVAVGSGSAMLAFDCTLSGAGQLACGI